VASEKETKRQEGSGEITPPPVEKSQEPVITDTFLDLFAKMADTPPEEMSTRLENGSVEDQRLIDSTSNNLANASAEEIKAHSGHSAFEQYYLDIFRKVFKCKFRV